MMQDTTLVIVSYNSAHLLEERLREYAGLPVVVVDNASSDGLSEWLPSTFPDVRFIESKVNSGYGRAANRGFDEVETPFALLANPDAVIGRDAIDSLEFAARELGQDWLFIAPNTGLSPESREPVSPSLDRVTAASGAALFFNMAQLRKLDGFDPNIFLFFEETDLCRRAGDSGIEMYYAAGIPVEHELGTSTHRTVALEYTRKWHYNWSSLYFSWKHRLWGRFAKTIWKNLVVAAFKLRRLPREESRYVLCHARHYSARAFLAGRAAFLPSGEPYREPILRELEGRTMKE
jgi:GT2 family glycosyltransferase